MTAVMREQVLPTGMDPMEIGRRVLQRNSAQRLYILTHPEYEPGLRERFDAILASFPTETPPAARVAASAGVLRHPMFAAERDRRLAERRKSKPPGASQEGAQRSARFAGASAGAKPGNRGSEGQS